MHCTFCRICHKEEPASIIYEDDKVIIIKNKYPKTTRHFLLIPKIHIKDITDMDTEEKISTLTYIIFNLRKFALQCGLVDFGVNTKKGTLAGQSEFHLHFHLYMPDMNNNDVVV